MSVDGPDRWLSTNAWIDDGSSCPARSRRRRISRATSSEASSAQCSAERDDADRVAVLAGHQVVVDGSFEIGFAKIGFRECRAEVTVLLMTR